MEILDSIVGQSPTQEIVSSPFAARAAERFLRAQVLGAVGRSEEAARWLETIAQRSLFELLVQIAEV